jgi:hypothetical protein
MPELYARYAPEPRPSTLRASAADAGASHMSAPRPANMFQHPQETKLAPMRDKLLFIEALTASGVLTGRELRVAILLTMRYSTTHGCAKPSMDYIAAALGLDKSNVAKMINSLVAKRWFFVERGNFRLGGKGHVNQYRPNAERVSSATPFHDHGTTDVPDAKGVKTSAKGVKTTAQRVSPATTDTVPYTESTYTASLRSASHSQSDDAIDLSDPQYVMGQLKLIERCLAARESGTWTEADEPSLQELADYCDEACEAFDSHTGDPIGGLAYRLAQDLGWELNNLVPVEKPCATPPQVVPPPVMAPAAKPEQSMNGHASLNEIPTLAEPVEAKRVWRTPKITEVLDLDRHPKGRKFGPWLAQRRHELGVQMRDLADAIGIKASDLFDIETGRVGLGIAMQRKAVAYLRERAA